MSVVFQPVLDFADIFDLDGWQEMRDCGAIIRGDGDGYWMKGENLESDVSCFQPRPEWATHVAWYNR